MTFYVDSRQHSAAEEFAKDLEHRILSLRTPRKETVFLCVGTDRLTGDCLGPYVGQELLHLFAQLPQFHVYGTLEHPVHALNLERARLEISRNHPEGLIIAIDASLGSKKHLGYVTIGDGALQPGAGVYKKLPAIGSLHITGIVSTSGFLEQWMLQTTPLSTVIGLADVITAGIRQVLLSGVL